MEIRSLTADYAVSPQIAPEDVAAIAEAGFTTLICNRPDAEIPAEINAEAIRQQAEAAGLRFVLNPVVGGAITMENVLDQGRAINDSDGPVLAYCASGNRSSIVWALAHAGKRPTDELIAIPARFGYALEPFRPTLEQLANG
ncbi:MAG: TIGR01244 family phosphatase [Rhodobacteraceae bacterium]|nr:TIGR01244 family phosphatase [Paracoccaceae bacterium]